MVNFFNPSGAALTSNKDDWETPALLFRKLDEKYSFDLDAAASDENHKVDKYFTANDDALKQKWGGQCVCQPTLRKKYSCLGRKSASGKCSRSKQKNSDVDSIADGHELLARFHISTC